MVNCSRELGFILVWSPSALCCEMDSGFLVAQPSRRRNGSARNPWLQLTPPADLARLGRSTSRQPDSKIARCGAVIYRSRLKYDEDDSRSPSLSMSPPSIPKAQTVAIVPHSGGGVVIVHDHSVKTQAELAPGDCLIKLHCTGACHTDPHAAFADWPLKAKTLIGGHGLWLGLIFDATRRL